MTTLTSPAPQPAAAGIPAKAHWTFTHQVRSEWIKFWSVRSTVWTLAIMAVAIIGFVMLISLIVRSNPDDFSASDGAPAFFPFIGAMQFAPLAVVVLGVLTITGEYTTGMIRASITAAPRRTPILWAKLVVLVATIFVLALVVLALSVAVQTPMLSSVGLSLDLGDSETRRILLGDALYLTTVAAFAFALGALMRHSAAAIATILGLLLVIENVINGIPWEPLEYVRPFLPASAGARLTWPQAVIDATNETAGHGIHLSAWGGYGILVAWVAVLLTFAALLMKRRDA